LGKTKCKISTFLDFVENQNLGKFGIKPNDPGLHGEILSVSCNYRQKGIATCLVKNLTKLATQLNAKYLYVISTSPYTRKILIKYKFIQVYSIKYDEYLLEEEIIFKNIKQDNIACYFFIKILK